MVGAEDVVIAVCASESVPPTRLAMLWRRRVSYGHDDARDLQLIDRHVDGSVTLALSLVVAITGDAHAVGSPLCWRQGMRQHVNHEYSMQPGV